MQIHLLPEMYLISLNINTQFKKTVNGIFNMPLN